MRETETLPCKILKIRFLHRFYTKKLKHYFETIYIQQKTWEVINDTKDTKEKNKKYSVRYSKILKYTRLKFFLHNPSINYKHLLSKYTRSMVQRVNLFNSCTMKVFDTTTNLTLYKSVQNVLSLFLKFCMLK